MKVVDKKTLTETFQYFDNSIVVEIIDIFINEQPQRMASIREAITNGDFEALKFEAHSIKGVIANFAAEVPVELSRTLEKKGTNNDVSGLEDLIIKLDQATKDLVDDLKELREEYLA